ncbi:MAG TPA: hypothetical protein VH062_21045 [Polyangiaceae bacterium]|jgi:hypothetical protein|nr:hypothetical protein [Polyangiaceae bacterium]
MRVYQIVTLAIVLGTAVPIYLHHDVHGVANVHQAALAFFLWLNAIIALWEICLFLRIDLIEEQHARFTAEYRGRELDRVKDFFALRVPLGRVFSPTVWAELWSSYSVFDPSYADRKSFGFFVDVGNGFSTLVPTLLFLYGMTYEWLPARALGVVGLLVFYQMWYGTVVYLASYVMNKRYRGHSFGNVALFVGLSNGLWLSFPLWGIAVSITMIGSGSYAIFH